MGLTAIILTNRSENDFRSTEKSLQFADETIILRGGLLKDFAKQRNHALKQAQNEWVLYVDDDEIVTRELAQEIKKAITKSNFSGYFLKRIDRYHHRLLSHGETGSIKLLRLAKKDAGIWKRPVHEYWQVTGRVGQLSQSLIHERNDLTESFINRVILYGPIDAGALVKENKPFTYWRLLIYPIAKFIFNYKLKLGFLDGILGLFQAYLMSLQSLSVRVYQWQEKS